jgi:SAM-dependent methyltransferase
VVPWGRSLDEYREMFALTPEDLRGRILDCGSGPASFNAEATGAGHQVISCDPLYRFSADAIRRRVEETADTLLASVREHPERFVWHHIESPERLREMRLSAMHRFLEDLPAGLESGRYRTDALPHLRFADDAFDLALCSHLLFLYSDTFSLEFHLSAVEEMARVADEVRVFPLLGAYGVSSPHLRPLVGALRDRGYAVEIRRVPYEFLRGGNEVLSVSGP